MIKEECKKCEGTGEIEYVKDGDLYYRSCPSCSKKEVIING